MRKRNYNNAVGPQVRSKDGPDYILPGLAILAVLSGVWVATQYAAHLFLYQAALGQSIGHLYWPWSIIGWWHRWYEAYPNVFMQSGSLGVMASSIPLLGLVIAKMVRSNSSKANIYLHGSARWANRSDIREAGLLPRRTKLSKIVTGTAVEKSNDGVYVGAWVDKRGNQHYLRHFGPEHVLCYAPTRSGKGVGLVLPTLLSWGQSAVVTDLKGELWAMTAGWRHKHGGNKVLRFEPATRGGVTWNPLDEIRIGTEQEVGDVQNLATLLVDPDGKGLESHWQKTSQALLVGVILHALYKAKAEGTTASLSSVDAMLADPNRPVGELWMEMVTYCHTKDKNHPVVGTSARDMMDRPDDEAGSVLSTAKSYLSLYRDPVVAANTNTSNFHIRDLMHSEDPVTLYIVTQPSDKARLRPLVRVMVNMIIRLLADKMLFEKGQAVKSYKHRLLMMLDEFPALGKLEILQESLAFLAGYGIKCYLICQDINQLRSRESGYGPDETITSNCHVQNAFPPNRVETAYHHSKLTGQPTVVKEQITTSGRRTPAVLGPASRTVPDV